MVVVVTNCIPVNEAYAIEYAPVLRTLHVYVLRGRQLVLQLS